MSGLQDLDWLAGSWKGGTGSQRTEEHWTEPAGGTMLGLGRTIEGDRTVHREQMVIEAMGAEIVYGITVADRPQVEFRLVRTGESEAVFENLAHDFPQRIIYSRVEDVLRARIEDAAGHRRMEWSWHRAQGW